MKWKLTNRFLMTILTIVFIVIVVNVLLLFVILYKEATSSVGGANDEKAEVFTTDFKQYISLDNQVPIVSEAGLTALKNRNAWMQILDENGSEVAEYFSPEEAPTHYRPIDMIQHYKYQEFDGMTTIYVSNFEQYSYILGIVDQEVSRHTFTLKGYTVLQMISKYLLYIVIVDLIIALIAGLMFGSLLTKPLYAMIDGIQQLKNRDFHLRKVKRPGIYKQVFINLQDVSTELGKQEAERKKLEQIRNEWISNVSHDMKTPLASIQGYAELLNDPAVTDAERMEYAQVIERKSIYMRELIDDFNLTMKLRQQEMPLQLANVRVEKLLRDLIIDVLNDPQFSMREVIFESTAPELVLKLDEHLMKRALLNFIVNAFIHNEDNTVVTVLLKVTENNHATIEIRDNGRGMNTEVLANVFERYYRGSNTENIRGTGLGTAIARDIIVAHGGEVTINSVEGSGTVVRVEI